jgi:hypothetical protein
MRLRRPRDHSSASATAAISRGPARPRNGDQPAADRCSRRGAFRRAPRKREIKSTATTAPHIGGHRRASPAQIADPGSRTRTISCSTPAEQRGRKRSAKVVSLHTRRVCAKVSPTATITPALPKGSMRTPGKPFS